MLRHKILAYCFLILAGLSIVGMEVKAQSTQGTISVSSGGADGDNCIFIDTRVNILNLRNSNGLVAGCHYIIIDHVQGRLVAGTEIQLHAISSNEFSENVSVNTTYDNEAWRGIYDIDRGLVLELQDNRNNIARGINGTEVTNFDWGNVSYTNVVVDNATLTVDIGNAATKQNVTVTGFSILNLTNFTGVIQNFEVNKVANVNFTGANGTWRLMRVWDGGSFNASGYTGGGDNYYNTIWGASTINYSNTTSLITFQQNDIHSSTINNTGVTTGTFRLTGSKVLTSTITHATGAGNFSVTSGCVISGGATINHQVGSMSLISSEITGSTVQQFVDNAASMTLIRVNVSENSFITNSAGTMKATDCNFSKGSNLTNVTGSLGTTTVNATELQFSQIRREATATTGMSVANTIMVNNSSIYQQGNGSFSVIRYVGQNTSTLDARSGVGGNFSIADLVSSNGVIIKLSGSTAGNLTVNGGTILESGGFIQTNGTGSLAVSSCNISSSSGINVTSGNRSYNFTRCIFDNVSRATLSGTAGGTGDVHNEFNIRDRAVYSNSCSGGTNSISTSEIAGLSATLSLTGTTGGKTFDRVKMYDGQIYVNNNPNTLTLQLVTVRDVGVLNLTSNGVGDVYNYIDISNQSTVTINKTSVSSIASLHVMNGGIFNMTGTAGAVSKVIVEQGRIDHSGGSLTNVSKKMQSTFTVSGGAQNNVHHWTTTNKTTSVNNTNRVDYLGVTSSVPIL